MLDSLSMFDKILYLLLTHSMISRNAFVSICASKVPAYKALKKALELKYIKQGSFKYKVKKKRIRVYSVTYYTITVHGIRYLKEKLYHIYPWIQYIDTSSRRLTVRGIKSKLVRVERFIRIANTATMLAGVGIDSGMTFLAQDEDDDRKYTNGDEEERWWEMDLDDGDCEADCSDAEESGSTSATLGRIVKEGIAMCEAVQGQNKNCEAQNCEAEAKQPPIQFYSSITMKQHLGIEEEDKSNIDYLFGRYTGMVESSFKSVMLFTDAPYGFQWVYRLANRDVSAFKRFSHTQCKYKHITYDDTRAAVIVPNASAFETFYFQNKDMPFNDRNRVGAPFSHFYLIPATYTGLTYFKKLMLTDDSLEGPQFIEDAIASGVYRRNEIFNPSLFPLINQGGAFFHVGTSMDIAQIQRVERMSQLYADRDIGILCFPWQLEYYMKILPNLKYMTVEW